MLIALTDAAEPAMSGPGTWELLATVLTVLTSLTALGALVASTGWGSAFLVRRVLTGTRRRTVVRSLVKGGVCTRRAARAAASKLGGDLVRGQNHDANAELEWLATLRNDGLPFVFNTDSDESRQRVLTDLATEYELMAGRWRSRLLFGTRGSELVASAAAVAQETAELLRNHATNERLADVDDAPFELDLRARGHFAEVYYSDRNVDLVVSPHPGRLDSVPGQLVEGGAQPEFEGVLPHLLGQQVELDRQSGRSRLHLAISEMPFSALRKRNTSWSTSQKPTSSRSHAVSLALMPVTSDGYALCARRSEGAGSYPGMIGPYVTGNAELRDRKGLKADRSEAGLPDLLAATCREAREEVGLVLAPDQLRVLGLARIWSPEDTGIWCLMTTAPLTITADEAGELVRYGDPVEGSWEVGNELLAVNAWCEPDAARQVLRWAASANLVPQAVACLVALLNKSGCDIAIDWTAAATSQSTLPDSLIRRVPTRHPYR